MRNKPNSRPRRAGRGRRDDDAKQTQFGPPTGRGRGVAGPIVPNKPNRPKRGRRGEPWGTRDEGHCTNKPSSCPYADSEIGVPGRQLCQTNPIGRRRACQTNPIRPGLGRARFRVEGRCETKPIRQMARWDQQNPARQTKPISPWMASGEDAQPSIRSRAGSMKSRGQSYQTKPIPGCDRWGRAWSLSCETNPIARGSVRGSR
jgi:hypothetical protein